MKGSIAVPFIIMLGATFVFLGVAEVVLRMLFSEPISEERYLLWNPPFIVSDPDSKAIHYVPNNLIREVLIYEGKKEYDTEFPTNNLGLIDNENYGPDFEPATVNFRYGILGDSFTAGVGGGPWVASMRDRFRQKHPNTQIYNLALLGASIGHFAANLDFFSKKLTFNSIIAIVISNDFHRLYWFPMVDGSNVRLCPEGESVEVCKKRQPMATFIPYEASTSDLFRHVAEVKKERQLLNEEKNSIFSDVKRIFSFSRFFTLLFHYIEHEPLFVLAEKKQEIGTLLKKYMKGKNVISLKQLRDRYPLIPFTVIHLPEKGEVERRHYDIDLENDLKGTDIHYIPVLKECQWSEDFFYEHDTHPNKKGYEKISECVEREIEKL